MNGFFALKVLASAIIIALASELSKKSSAVATVLLALPFTSILTLIWVRYESEDVSRLISLSWSVFWLVPPSLAFFPAFALLLSRQLPFWLAFFLSAGITVLVYLVYAKCLGFFGIEI